MNRRVGSATAAWQTALFLLAGLPISVLALTLDARLVNDIAIWIKPIKFQLSLVLHLATLALIVNLMPTPQRDERWLRVIVWLVAAACVLEVLLICMQATRGVGSHFNISTPFDVAVYRIMGVGALSLTLPLIAIGLRFVWLPTSSTLTPTLRLGVIYGLSLGAVLTFGIAGYLSIQSAGHWVDAPRTDLGGVPVFGWSRTGGDLRVPHFFATHLMQALPLTGWLLDRISHPTARWPRVVMTAIAIAGVAVTMILLAQARRGQAFL